MATAPRHDPRFAEVVYEVLRKHNPHLPSPEYVSSEGFSLTVGADRFSTVSLDVVIDVTPELMADLEALR
jgi:hypothetical protein